MLIRPEIPADYHTIGNINAIAFGNRAAEAAIVALLRQHARFDPELSLVAVLDDQVVGHVLFTPYTLRLLGQDVAAVNLAPIAIHPAYQRQGIGQSLIEEGHNVARSKGYALSFLLGHPEYYSRFGYKTHSHGWSELILPTPAQAESALEVRPPTPGDLPALWDLWRIEEHEVDFALDPGRDLLDWISPNPAIHSEVYLRNNEVVGYVRVHEGDLAKPSVFLAADANAAREMVANLGQRIPTGTQITLPLHPRSASAPYLGQPSVKAWAAGMACSLAPSPFEEYYAQAQRRMKIGASKGVRAHEEAGERPTGRIIWPVAFELA